MKDASHYREVEAALLSILADLGPEWTEDDKAAVREELDYGEYGLAVEVLAGSAVNLGRPLSPELRARIAGLADRLELQESAMIVGMRKLQAA